MRVSVVVFGLLATFLNVNAQFPGLGFLKRENEQKPAGPSRSPFSIDELSNAIQPFDIFSGFRNRGQGAANPIAAIASNNRGRSQSNGKPSWDDASASRIKDEQENLDGIQDLLQLLSASRPRSVQQGNSFSVSSLNQLSTDREGNSKINNGRPQESTKQHYKGVDTSEKIKSAGPDNKGINQEHLHDLMQLINSQRGASVLEGSRNTESSTDANRNGNATPSHFNKNGLEGKSERGNRGDTGRNYNENKGIDQEQFHDLLQLINSQRGASVIEGSRNTGRSTDANRNGNATPSHFNKNDLEGKSERGYSGDTGRTRSEKERGDRQYSQDDVKSSLSGRNNEGRNKEYEAARSHSSQASQSRNTNLYEERSERQYNSEDRRRGVNTWAQDATERENTAYGRDSRKESLKNGGSSSVESAESRNRERNHLEALESARQKFVNSEHNQRNVNQESRTATSTHSKLNKGNSSERRGEIGAQRTAHQQRDAMENSEVKIGSHEIKKNEQKKHLEKSKKQGPPEQRNAQKKNSKEAREGRDQEHRDERVGDYRKQDKQSVHNNASPVPVDRNAQRSNSEGKRRGGSSSSSSSSSDESN